MPDSDTLPRAYRVLPTTMRDGTVRVRLRSASQETPEPDDGGLFRVEPGPMAVAGRSDWIASRIEEGDIVLRERSAGAHIVQMKRGGELVTL